MMIKNKNILLILIAISLFLPSFADARRVKDYYSVETVTALKQKVEDQAVELRNIINELGNETRYRTEMEKKLEEELNESDKNEPIIISHYKEQIKLATDRIEGLTARYRQLNEQYGVDVADYCQRCIVLIERGEMDELAARYANALTQVARLGAAFAKDILGNSDTTTEVVEGEHSASEIADIVVSSNEFYYYRHSIFLSGIPDSMGEAVAEAIRTESLSKKRDFLIMQFKDLVSLIKSWGDEWDFEKIDELKTKNIVAWGYYAFSDEFEHTIDDVLQTLRHMRGWRNDSIGEHHVMHVFLSAEEIDWTIFTPEQELNTPLINYFDYRHIDGDEMKYPGR